MLLQKIESAEWKRYNANTRDADVGDCVKRALTIAYSMDYDEVSKELNRIKRKTGKSAYNLTSVYYKFCEARGNTFRRIKWTDLIDPTTGGLSEDVKSRLDTAKEGAITVSDICDTFPKGTYLLEVGSKPGKYSTHLCVVVDGNLYDSWDSRNWYVDKWSVVTRSETPVFDVRWQDISDKIDEYLLVYLGKLESKYSEFEVNFHMGDPRNVNRYTYEFVCFIHFSQFPPESSKYHQCKSWGHEFTVKLNPRMDEDTNCTLLQKKIAQKIYDWVYNIIKDVKDAKALEEFDWGDSSFTGAKYRYYSDEKKLIMNLPDWCRKLITHVYINDNPDRYGNGYKYEMYMDPLPDDPHPERGDVSFYADTLRELKDQLASYKENGARYNYEY